METILPIITVRNEVGARLHPLPRVWDSVHRERYPSKHMLVISQHPLQQETRGAGIPGMHWSSPGPHSGKKFRGHGLGGTHRPIPQWGLQA